MQNTNITALRKNIFGFLEQTIKYNEPINVATKDGNAVIISEKDYNGMMETLMINANPKFKDSLLEGRDTPIKDCIPEDEVKW